jgi:hypothetical protein
VANCPSPTYGIGLMGICVNVCPIDTYYMVYSSIRLCVDICYPNYYADVSRTCVSATSCPSSPVAYFGDDSTGLCVTGILFVMKFVQPLKEPLQIIVQENV